jgi:excisionase family DNA binding protein
MPARLLTARELADELGLSAETVLRWTRTGRLPGFRLPSGQLRYRRDEIEAWLNDHATAPGRGAPSTPTGAVAVVSQEPSTPSPEGDMIEED